jgi:hypothetical protein
MGKSQCVALTNGKVLCVVLTNGKVLVCSTNGKALIVVLTNGKVLVCVTMWSMRSCLLINTSLHVSHWWRVRPTNSSDVSYTHWWRVRPTNSSDVSYTHWWKVRPTKSSDIRYNKYNKRPMDHIAHLSNLNLYRNIICISFPFAPFNLRVPMILINLPLFYVRKLSCKIQPFWFHSS